MIGFLFPALLAGLAAIAVPVIIHFFYRRQLKVIPISTLRFLKLADQTLPRQPRLQHLLLLLLRCLLVALLAFFLAKPYFAKAKRPPVHRVILVDRSMSMTGEPLQTAKKISTDLVGGLRYEDTVSAIAFDENPVPAAAPRNRLRQPVTSGLTAIQAQPKGTSPRLVIQDVARYFEDNASTEALILTDLRSTDVSEWLESMNLVRESKHPGRVILIPCTTNAAPNFAITMAQVSSPTTLTIQISSTLPQPFDKKVETIINDQSLGLTTAHSATGETVTLNLPLPSTITGEFCGSAKLVEDDALPLDNQRAFCFKPGRANRLLLVDGVPSKIASLSETYYLNVALNAWPDKNAFSVVTQPLDQVPWDNLTGFGTLLFADVARFTPEQTARIAAFVREGGTAIFALGDQVDVAAYNQMPEHLLPATLGPTVGEATHRLETYFTGQLDPTLGNVEAWRRCRFFAFVNLQNPAAEAKIPARFNTGQPMLIENAFGKGRVYLFASSVSALWNDFPLHPAYLGFWKNLLFNAPPANDTDKNIPARESFTAPATPDELTQLKKAGFEILPATDTTALAKFTGKPEGDSVPLAGWLALLAVVGAAGEWIFSNHLSKEGDA